MASKNAHRIERILEKGKWAYVFWHGVVLWGITTALFFQGFMFLWRGVSSTSLMTSLIVFPLVGIFFGLYMWHQLNSQGREDEE